MGLSNQALFTNTVMAKDELEALWARIIASYSMVREMANFIAPLSLLENLCFYLQRLLRVE